MQTDVKLYSAACRCAGPFMLYNGCAQRDLSRRSGLFSAVQEQCNLASLFLIARIIVAQGRDRPGLYKSRCKRRPLASNFMW